MFVLSNVTFIGLGLVAVGLVGFVVMAVVLGDHPGLFAIVICWYAFILSWASIALRKDVHWRRARSRSR